MLHFHRIWPIRWSNRRSLFTVLRNGLIRRHEWKHLCGCGAGVWRLSALLTRDSSGLRQQHVTVVWLVQCWVVWMIFNVRHIAATNPTNTVLLHWDCYRPGTSCDIDISAHLSLAFGTFGCNWYNSLFLLQASKHICSSLRSTLNMLRGCTWIRQPHVALNLLCRHFWTSIKPVSHKKE